MDENILDEGEKATDQPTLDEISNYYEKLLNYQRLNHMLFMVKGVTEIANYKDYLTSKATKIDDNLEHIKRQNEYHKKMTESLAKVFQLLLFAIPTFDLETKTKMISKKLLAIDGIKELQEEFEDITFVSNETEGDVDIEELTGGFDVTES